MTTRSVKIITQAQTVDMGGLQVKQPLPHEKLRAIDPFLLLHHLGPIQFDRDQHPREQGVPPHPHRGFEPVTFIYKGGVHHRDSRGNDSIISAGGVQWMTAGMGVVHSERPPRAMVDAGGEQEIIQLWINLSAEFKMVQPRYQGFNAEDIPVLDFDDRKVQVQVVAGTFENQAGPVNTHSRLMALNILMQKDGRHVFELPAAFNAFAYLLDGACKINNSQTIQAKHLVHFADDGDSVSIEATAETRLLLMGGEPIREPVVMSGPFVMNTHTEIMEAMRDAQMGKMGVLIEEF